MGFLFSDLTGFFSGLYFLFCIGLDFFFYGMSGENLCHHINLPRFFFRVSAENLCHHTNLYYIVNFISIGP